MTENPQQPEPFEQDLLDPSEWRKCAQSIFDSAKLFEPQVDGYWRVKGKEREDAAKYYHTYLMLCGYAFENIFKALIVVGRHDALREECRKRRGLPKLLRSHVLLSLAKAAGLEVTEEPVAEILRRLTRHSIWQGRYPFPLDPKDLPAEDTPFGQFSGMVPISLFTSRDKPMIQHLFSLALKILESRISLREKASQVPS